MAYKFEIHKDKTGPFRVRFKYNGEVIFSTEAYTTKASAQKAIEEEGPAAPIEDLTADLSAKVRTPRKPSASTSAKSVAATVAAAPWGAAKSAARAVGSAMNSAVQTTTRSQT